MWNTWALRRFLQGIEATFTAGWSVGEVAYAVRHPRRLLADPHREVVLADIDEHGLYKTFPDEVREVRPGKRGWIVTPNPYTRVGDGKRDLVVAQLRRHRQPRQRELLLVCHCYGLPMPPLMEYIFGLDRLEGFDVVYNIMNHHYLGSFGFWPGFGLMSPQMSRLLENVRSAVTGLRTLIQSLVHTYGYERVTLLGYSIGGHISLHVANHHRIDRLVAYCPVTSLRRTATELGLMRHLSGGVSRALGKLQGEFDFGDLDRLDTLNQPMLLSPEQLLFIFQSHDVMVPMDQSDALRQRYPTVRCLEFPGTHAFPVEQQAMQRALHGWLQGGPGKS